MQARSAPSQTPTLIFYHPGGLISRISVLREGVLEPATVLENGLMDTPDLLIMYRSGNISRSATVP